MLNQFHEKKTFSPKTFFLRYEDWKADKLAERTRQVCENVSTSVSKTVFD